MERYIIYMIAVLGVAIAVITLIVEKRKGAQLLKRLEETEESLGVAIETADMFFFDYYPEKKLAIAISKLDAPSFGKVITDYPRVWFENQTIHPDDLERVKEIFEEIDVGRKSVEIEYRILVDEVYHWFLYHMQSVYGERGERIKVVVSRTDITPRKEMELEYQRHLNAMFFNHRDTLLSCRMNLTKNRVMEFYTVQDMLRDKLFISFTVNEMMETIGAFVTPIYRKRCLEKFSRENLIDQFNEGNYTISYAFSYMVHDEVRWAECVAEMAKEPGNADIDTIFYVTDVSYRRIIELVIDSAANHDYDYLTFVYGKSKRYVHYTWLVPESFSFQERYDSYLLKYFLEHEIDDREKVTAQIKWEAIEENLRQNGEYSVFFTLSKSGKKKRKKLQFFYIDDGEELILVSQNDVTDIYEAEQAHQEALTKALAEAEKANAAKTDFLARMSHDIRTPMNAIIGITALALDETDNPKAIEENLTKINSASHFLLGLINDILDMTKIEDGSVELNREPYAYDDFIGNLRTMFEPLCRERELTLQIHKSDKEPTIMTDKIRLNQIFFNVLSNAVKYTSRGGRVSYYEENVLIEENRLIKDYIVQDNGVGMSEEFQQRMFQPFAQESNEMTAEVQGTGLGLSITKSLTELMGGTLRIESELGKGTKVIIHLELDIATEDELALVNQKKKGTKGEEVLEGKRLLLVEDHPINTEIAKRILEKKGIKVFCAENGRVGVEKFESSNPGFFDVILMDIRMPEMTGLEATKAIRALERED
ncbi:MAG: response regulator, partial [Lachnospiraceae bacterium]|nr:response regulator [Lachnospiraceae bacterium]